VGWISEVTSNPREPWELKPRTFTAYKLFNSLFTGLSVGAVFTLYSPLDPEIFSAGGIGLAVGMLLIATQYHRLLNIRWFFAISMLVELLMLLAVLVILQFRITEPTALAVYIGYQITFVFGGYLVRCETLLIADDRWLARIDIAKQTGYLIGMAGAWLLYRAMENNFGIADKTDQVIRLHGWLAANEIVVVLLLWKAFGRQRLERAPATDQA
jgi:putative membrane protein